MDGEGQTPDDLRVSLSWPGDDENAPERVQRVEPSEAEAESAVWQPPKKPEPEPVPAGQDEGAPEQPYLPEETVSGLRRRRPVESPRDSRPAHAPQPAASAPAPSMAAGLTSPDSSLSGRVDQLIVEMVATQARVDALTDAMTTLRGLVSERMADLGQVLSHTQSQITQDMREALAQAPGPAFPDGERTLEGAQDRIARDVDKALTRFQSQSARYLNEALMEAQARTTQDIDSAVTRAATEALSQTEEATARWQAQSSRQADRLQQRYEHTTVTIEGVATNQNRRLDRLVEAMSAELGAVGQQVSDQVSASALTQRSELVDAVGGVETAVAIGTDRVVADVSALAETVAEALTQVADRLEALVQGNAGREDVVEAVADALVDVAGRVGELEQAGRSRHDRLMAVVGELRSDDNQEAVDLRPVTAALANVEMLVEALAESAEDDRGVAELMQQVEALPSSVADRFDRTTTEAVRALSVATEQAAEQIKAAPPPPVDLSSITAMTRIEDRLSELTRQREEDEQVTRTAMEGLEETVSRLATAQAEDLERILDTVENFAAPAQTAVSLSEDDAQRLARIEAELSLLARRPVPPAAASEADSAFGEQLLSLGAQIEALRRRLAVRARAPTFDDDAIDALADAVAARLAAQTPARPATRAARPPARAARPAEEATGRASRRPPTT